MKIRSADNLINAVTDQEYGINGLIDRLTSNSVERLWTLRQSRIDGVGALTHPTQKEVSLWRFAGVPYSGGVTPTSWANPTRTTQGAFGQTDPVDTLRLILAQAACQSRGWIVVYDRLGHCGGLDGNTTSTQNINGGSDATITRGGGYVGNELWVEIYDAIGATARLATVAYKNESGASKTSPSFTIGGTGNNAGSRIIRVPLAAGDRGVSAVVSIAIASAGTGTTGNFGVSIVRPLTIIPASAIGGAFNSLLEGCAPEIEAGACIAFTSSFGTATDDVQPNIELTFAEDNGTEVSQRIHRWIGSRIGGAAANTGAAGRWFSSWLHEGVPGHNTAPSSIAIPTRTSGLKQNNAGGGRQLWLSAMHAQSLAQTLSLVLSDRLLHVGGLSGTSTSLVNFNSGSPFNVDRDPTYDGDGLGIGNELWVEITGLIGNTPQTLTISYKDADNATQSATVSVGGTGRREAGVLLPVTLANDRGVLGLISGQLGGSTGTAGDIAIVVSHRIAIAHTGISTGFSWRGIDNEFPPIPTDACLWDHWVQGGAITAENVFVQAQYVLVER